MARITSRKKRESKERLQAYGMIALSSLILIGFGVALYWSSQSTPLRSADLCPETGPQAVHAALVDLSEPFSVIQKSNIQQRLAKFRDGVRTNEKLVLYFMEEVSDSLPPPAFEYCNPGDPKDAHWLYENEKIFQRRYRESIGKFEVQLETAGRTSSPVMEMLQVISVSEFSDPELSSNIPKRLLIVSDMVQHSDAYSHYRSPVRQYSKLASTATFRKLNTDLSGVDVEIAYVQRDGDGGSRQGPLQVKFWSDYFTSGLRSETLRIRKIDG